MALVHVFLCCMVARRTKQTSDSGQHTIRFYKVVALTFLCITLILFGVIMFMSTKRATITITTKTEPVDITTQVWINNADKTQSIIGDVELIETSVTQSFSPTSEREEPGTATGVVTLYN